MIETWKDVVGYEGLYQASSFGRIRSQKFRIMKPYPCNGYQRICLSRNGIVKKEYVHRIIAACFVEKPSGKDFVNHKDHNRLNNAADNLEWLTRLENIRYSSPLNRKVSPLTKSKSGHKYIYGHGEKFFVCIRQIGFYRTRKTIEEAIKTRDSALPMLSKYYEGIDTENGGKK